jgi:hypothetical protein
MITKFRNKVLMAWFDLGKNATSREIADHIGARAEGCVSNAMTWLEVIGEGPTSTAYWNPYKSRQRIFNVHSPDQCKGKHCPVHNPSDHHMKDWPQYFRSDRSITERLCPHGTGHPDPDDPKAKGRESVHGCDGCCSSKKRRKQK